jgi:hypothetical protein
MKYALKALGKEGGFYIRDQRQTSQNVGLQAGV